MKAHELLSDKTKWTQYAAARNADGQSTYPNDQSAVKWCALGAIHRCYRTPDLDAPLTRLREYLDTDISYANDFLGYKFIIGKLRELNI